jgi:PAS domain S-box-containing protein
LSLLLHRHPELHRGLGCAESDGRLPPIAAGQGWGALVVLSQRQRAGETDMSKANILIVEDEAIVAADLANKLRQLGYGVSGTTARGEEALVLAGERRPDLVLMDIRLAGRMDGVEAAERIRQEWDLPVIYLTAHSDRATLQRAKLTEPFGYILKPFAEREIESHIEIVLYKHQAGQALRGSEARYRLLFDRNPDGLFALDATGRFVVANPACEVISGYSTAELLQKTFEAVCAPDALDRTVENFERVLREGKAQQVETAVLRKDGRRVELWVTGEPLTLDQKTVVHCSAKDITQRKRMEECLRFLAECGSTPAGEDFFRSLARYLAWSLSMDYVGIDRLEAGSLEARTEVVFAEGRFKDNLVYTLKDTPGGEVVGKRICCFPSEARQMFPKDRVLRELQAESYVGTTLWSSGGRPIGLIAVAGRQPLADPQLATSILQLVGVRAAGELERRGAEEAIQRHAEELQVTNEELHRFNQAMVGRELRMIELKQEINALCAQLGQPPRYQPAVVEQTGSGS